MTKSAETNDQPALWEAPAGMRARAGRPAAAGPDASSKLKDRRPTRPMEFEDMWTIDQVANYLGVPKQTIYCWPTSGYGPQGFRVGKHLRWRAATVIAWTVDLEHKQ